MGRDNMPGFGPPDEPVANPKRVSLDSPAAQAEIGLIAQQGVTAFLEMVGRGLPVAQCSNSQCRVALYTVDAILGRKIATCPGCYGSPSEGG